MAVWLWVTNLDPKNDWIELKNFNFGGPRDSGFRSGGSGLARGSNQEATFTLDPGRFLMRFYNWSIRGEQRTVYVFFDPQTEYQFSDSMASGVSTNSDDNLTSVTINFTKMKVVHSGAP